MKFLALDSSQVESCACIIEDGKVTTSEMGSTSVAHSEALLPLVDRLLKKTSLNEIDAFAVGIGPGSFTGLRIGCATIKALAQVQDKPILGFSSLKALVLSEDEEITPGAAAFVNAYQGHVFVGHQNEKDRQWSDSAFLPEVWLKNNVSERGLKLVGSGVLAYEDVLKNYNIQEGEVRAINPDGIRRVIAHEMKLKGESGVFRSYLNLAANYLRPSQAEIKLRNQES